MTREVQGALADSGQKVTDDPPRLARVILDSLAFRYASVVAKMGELTGKAVRGIHIVGGGCQNDYLNQATADASRLPVRAGPAEATAIGNLVLQALASGRLESLAHARRLVARVTRPHRFEPRDRPAWRHATALYREIEERYS
jgi:rhamnulokinase